METTLVTPNGEPKAYINLEDPEQTIWTWDGHAVAYLKDNLVYGWNGQHLGWFESGIIYDLDGYKVGYTANACPSSLRIEPIKRIKRIKRIRRIQRIPRMKRIFKTSNSPLDLLTFMQQGAV